MRNISISLVAGLILLIFFGTAFYRVLYDWYLSLHGNPVACKVLDVSSLCKKRNKSVVVLLDSKPFTIQLYGRKCRTEEFSPGKMTTTLLASANRKRLVPEQNAFPIRTLINLLFTIFSLIISVSYFKKNRRARNGV